MSLKELCLALLEKSKSKRFQSCFGILRFLKGIRDNSADFKLFETCRFQGSDIAQRVFCGRHHELEVLNEGIRSLKQGNGTIVEVCGPSGTGKSTLISRFCDEISDEEIFVFKGSFHHQNKNVPYTGIVEAFDGCFRYLLTLSDSRIQVLSEHLKGSLGPMLGVIAQLLPRLNMIVDDIPPVVDLPPIENEARFKHAMEAFLRVIVNDLKYCIFHFEDLQWIDPASKELLELLINNKLPIYLIVSSRQPSFLNEWQDKKNSPSKK